MLYIKGKIIRYGSRLKIASAGTYAELIGAEEVSLGPDTLERFTELVPVSQFSDKYLYVRARAISGFEKYGPNDNGDAFEWDELLKSYGSFVRGGVYKDHNNTDRRDSVGIIIDAWPNEVEEYVEVLLAINRKKAPNEVRQIEAGQLTDVSMGCVVDEAICSVCGNVARDEDEYCDHIKRGWKGKEVVNGAGTMVPCFEYNRGIRFFETSLISPWSEGADLDAKIKETIASKLSGDNFEDWVRVYSTEEGESEMKFGDKVLVEKSRLGVVVGVNREKVLVVVEGTDGRAIPFDQKDLQLAGVQTYTKEVSEMAQRRRDDSSPSDSPQVRRTAQGEGPEEFDMEHPFKGNPMRGRWHGDYGSPGERYVADYDRTEEPSDPVDLRGQQMSSELERGDYPHKGYTGDKAEGKAPIGGMRTADANAEELEREMEKALGYAADTGIALEEAQEKEAKKHRLLAAVKNIFGIGREGVGFTEHDTESPNRGNPMYSKDPENYQDPPVYQDAQKEEADTKDTDTRSDIEKQRPLTYSNTPENISKLRSVAQAQVDKVVDLLKKYVKDEKEQAEFIKSIRGLEDKDFDELEEKIKEVKEDEDKEVEKEKAAPPSAPPSAPPKKEPAPGLPGAPPKREPGPPGAPKPMPRPGPGAPMPRPTGLPTGPPMGLGAARIEARKRVIANALGQWGNEDPVDHAIRMIAEQVSKDPTIDPVSIFWLASDVRDLDDEQMEQVAESLHLEVPGITARTAAVDFLAMTDEELVGAYKFLKESGATADALNAVLTAMVERGLQTSATKKAAASKADVLNWIYSRMQQGVSFAQASKEASDKFDITDASFRTIDERPLGFGHETEGPGSSSELGHAEPSDGRYLGTGTPGQPGLWGGGTSRAYDERTPYKSSAKIRRKGADGAWLNDYDLSFGTNVRWDARTKTMAEQENTTQKRDFAEELREARKRKLTGARSLSDWKAALKKKEAPARVISQFEKIWKSSLDRGESEEYAARAAIDKVPKQYLEEPTPEHGPEKRGPISSKLQEAIASLRKGDVEDDEFMKMLEDIFAGEDVTIEKIEVGTKREAAATYTGPENLGSETKGAPSVDLSSEENKKQKKDFAAELKETTGLKHGRKITVVVGAGDESYEGEVARVIDEHGIIHVDYDTVNNRDAIDLKEGVSKLFGNVRVYARPEVVVVKKGNWNAVLTANKEWSLYNYKISPDRQKIAVVQLADILEGEESPAQETIDHFNSREFGAEVITEIETKEANGELEPESPTGLAPEVVVEEGEIVAGSRVRIADDWMPVRGESPDLVHDIEQLKQEGVEGDVQAVNPITEEVQVNFGADTPLLLTTAELTVVGRDSSETGTDVRWTEESKALSDEENRRQQSEFKKEETAAAFGPDSARNTHLAQRTAAAEGQWDDHILLMRTLVEDESLPPKQALSHLVEAFEMSPEETDAFVNSDIYVEVFEVPLAPGKTGREPEFGAGKEVVQMRTVEASRYRRQWCTRIAEDMLSKGMIEGITADMDEDAVQKALNEQIDKLMQVNDDGLYEWERAVKSATDPDGTEALRRSISKIGPREGALKQPMQMRGAGKKVVANTLDDSTFFGGPPQS